MESWSSSLACARLLLLLLFVNAEAQQCVRINPSFNCFTEYGHTTTHLPNAYGHQSLSEAEPIARRFNDSFAIIEPECGVSRHMMNEFICATFFPPCVNGQPYALLKPCPDWCELLSRCEFQLPSSPPARRITWPDCSRTGTHCWNYRHAGGDNSPEDSLDSSSSMSISNSMDNDDSHGTAAQHMYDIMDTFMNKVTDDGCLGDDCPATEPTVTEGRQVAREANLGEAVTPPADDCANADDCQAGATTVAGPATTDGRRAAARVEPSHRVVREARGVRRLRNLQRVRMMDRSCDSSDSGDCYEPAPVPTAAPRASHGNTTTDAGSNEATTPSAPAAA